MPVYEYTKKGKKNRGKKLEDIKKLETRYYFKCYYYDWKEKKTKAKLCRGKEYGYNDGFPSRKIAESFERKFMIANEGNRNRTFVKDYLFDEIMEMVLAKSKTVDKPQSYIAKESRLRLHVLPYFTGKYVSEIKKSDINNWSFQLEITTKMKRSSLNKCRSALHSIFRYVNDYLEMEYDPLALSKSFDRKQERPIKAVWTSEQFSTYMEYAKSHFKSRLKLLRFEVFCYIGFFAGLRPGETMALKWENIDMINKDICVEASVYIGKAENGRRKAILGSTKTSSSIRHLPLSKTLEKLLNEYRIECEKYYGFNEDWYIMSGAKITRYATYSTQLDDICNSISKDHSIDIKIPRITPHCLRHSFASRMHELGLPEAEISCLMGHSNINTTREIYTHAMHSEKTVNMIKNQ